MSNAIKRNSSVHFILLVMHDVVDCTEAPTDVTKTGNGERGTVYRERESGNECTAVIRIRIQSNATERAPLRFILHFFGRYPGLSFITGI